MNALFFGLGILAGTLGWYPTMIKMMQKNNRERDRANKLYHVVLDWIEEQVDDGGGADFDELLNLLKGYDLGR